mmetsp:Transcript_106628/g.308514  ORF Transcript_106628/g.308514 Transcript_106628/m.308514 type:complete len:247 (-) Transcript_106628:134-874(-)
MATVNPETYQPMPENDTMARSLKMADDAVRTGFVRKVYGILAAQLMCTVFVAAPFVTFGQGYVKSHQTWVGVSSAVLFTTMMIMSCCQDTARKFPQNYILLTIFTLAQGVVVGVVCTAYTVQSVALVVGTTALVFLAMTVYACTTTVDFTGFGSYLLAGLIAMLMFSMLLSVLACFGVPLKLATTVYSMMGVLLFTFYIIYDTQLIVGGDHSAKIEIDDYVFAAMMLYLDIINLFFYLLELFGDRN